MMLFDEIVQIPFYVCYILGQGYTGGIEGE